MTWEEFKALLAEEFYPGNEMEKLETEFWNHTMVGANHAPYTYRFHELAKLVPHLVTLESKRIGKYIHGLVSQIRRMLRATQPTTIQSAILTARILTNETVRCGTFSKGSEKRKEVEETSKQGGLGNDNKRAKVGKGSVVAAFPKNEYVGSYPKCVKCFAYHPDGGPSRLCYNCQKPDHFVRDCQAPVKQVAPVYVKSKRLYCVPNKIFPQDSWQGTPFPPTLNTLKQNVQCEQAMLGRSCFSYEYSTVLTRLEVQLDERILHSPKVVVQTALKSPEKAQTTQKVVGRRRCAWRRVTTSVVARQVGLRSRWRGGSDGEEDKALVVKKMASIVVPQALYMKPKTSNVAKLQSLKLGVSSFVPSLNASLSTGSSSRSAFKVVVADEEKPPRKPIVKLGDIMGILNKQAVEASESLRPLPELRTGDIIEIKLEVPENRRRLSIYKGIIISRQNAGIHTTIRIRRIIAGVGVEIVFPIYSPNIKEIKVVKHRKVRRARLYYLRDKLPRLSTFK
nr:50S ribosomal protein L19-2, chloroplastic-like [Tanacetum cinerariifolium]